jgi:putative membrane protein
VKNMMHYWAQPYGRGYGYGGSGLIGFLFMIGFGLVVAFLFILLIKGFRNYHKHEGDFEDVTSDKALNILKERYAKGEINKKEFEEMKKDILKS